MISCCLRFLWVSMFLKFTYASNVLQEPWFSAGVYLNLTENVVFRLIVKMAFPTTKSCIHLSYSTTCRQSARAGYAEQQLQTVIAQVD